MAASDEQTVEQVCAGSVRTASRLITRAEAGDSGITPILKQLYCRGTDTAIIGITGPPGAGKSTLVNQLLRYYRSQDLRVAVLAVDPSSPFSGGAILGDRVRMNEHAADAGVFIRSMAARGQLGGLAKATGDALTILQAMPFDRLILETVGVGQSEVEIMRHASTVLVLQIPGAGDGVQSVKAGVLEIGDIYLVNKADMPGAEELAAALEEMLHLKSEGANWHPPVYLTEALAGSGISEAAAAIDKHIETATENALHTLHKGSKAERRARHRVVEIGRQLLSESLMSEQVLSSEHIHELLQRRQDPYSLAEQLLAGNIP